MFLKLKQALKMNVYIYSQRLTKLLCAWNTGAGCTRLSALFKVYVKIYDAHVVSSLRPAPRLINSHKGAHTDVISSLLRTLDWETQADFLDERHFSCLGGQQQERKYSQISLEPYKYLFHSDPTVYPLWSWSLFLSYAAGVGESS